MRVHLQRKHIIDAKIGADFIEKFDRTQFPFAMDVQVEVIQDDEGLWIVIVQETSQPLEDVVILPGFKRICMNARTSRPA